ncbi:hypothetical protein C8F04DRAFT_1091073, partial [Mycena alexandri]
MPNGPIILYDIPSTAPGCAWSPNTWKTRYALNFKGLAYKTVWIEYPDIEDLCKEIGAEPTGVRKNGASYYSLPVIHDPKTGAIVSDSVRIADYLDSTYSDTPRVIPAGTHTLQKAFQVAYDQATDPSVRQYILPAVAKILRPKSEEYYVRTREASFGKKLINVVPTGEAHDTVWKEVETGFGKVDQWMNEGMNNGAPFVMGNSPTFTDFMIAGEMQWFMKGFGEDSDLFKDMMKWHGGRWAKLLKDLKKYEGPAEGMP